MNAMGNALLEGFEKYYNTLTKVGYISTNKVASFIVASWIYDVLEGKYDMFVDEDQYNMLNDLYNCIEGSCLVPYQSYCRNLTINKLPDNRYIRHTEINTIDIEGMEAGDRPRLLENGNLRMV